jgi:uncharacterized repeat protein (TIGR01451 family)
VAFFLTIIAAGIIYSASFAAPHRQSARAARPASPPATRASNVSRRAAVVNESGARNSVASLAGFMPLLQLPGEETIETFAADCVTPKTVFNLGDTVCAKVTNAPTSRPTRPLRRFSWAGPANVIRQKTNITASTQTDLFILPSSQTTLVGGESVDNRGEWAVASLNTTDGSATTQAGFSVRDPQNAAANLSVTKTVLGASDVAAGSNVAFKVFLTNRGPDDAASVSLSDAVPANTTFVSGSQSDGPSFTCANPTAGSTGTSNCTIASLPAGTTSEFIFIYEVGATVPVRTNIVNTASVTSDTSDPKPSDNSSSANAVVSDTGGATGCVLECPNNIVVAANATHNGQPDGTPGAFVTFGAAEPIGECGTLSTSHPSGSFFPVGTTAVTTTSSTGSASCSFDVIVTAGGGPTISCPANIVTPAETDCSATVNPGTPTTTGSGVTVEGVRGDGQALDAPYPVGTTIINWTATDDVGRTATCTQSVTVTNANDTTPPTITAPPAVSVSTGPDAGACGIILSESELGRATADDGGCSVNVTVTGIPPGNFFPIGTTTVTWKATDASGNTATATQTITVTDNTPPAIFAPADETYVCPSQVPAADPSQAKGLALTDGNGNPLPAGPPFDNCGGAVTVTVSETTSGAGSASDPLIITRTFTATDVRGNSSSDAQLITVIDSTPPTINAPAVVSVNADPVSCSVSGVALGTPTAADNCNTVTVTNNAPAAFPLGTTTVTWTATDGAGNTATATQTVTVVDVTAPSMSCPTDIVVHLPLNSTATSMAVNYSATATDNCGGSLPVTYSIAPGSVFNVGTTSVTASATDAAGNTASCTFTVSVLYNFTGFASPVSNLPTINSVNAGRAIPLKFSLSGNKGLGIMAAGYPASQQIACNTSAPLSELEGTETSGGSTLTYSPDQYHYNWKTEKSWEGTCRVLVVKLNDGTEHTALFKFK